LPVASSSSGWVVSLRSTCNDCGKPFDGEDAKAAAKHAQEAHPGMGRFRWRTSKGVSFIACPDCDHAVEEGSPRHLKSAGQYVPGKSSDPIDLFAAHQASHEGEA